MQLTPEKQQELEKFKREAHALSVKFFELAQQEKANARLALTAAMQLIHTSYKMSPAKDQALIKESILELLK